MGYKEIAENKLTIFCWAALLAIMDHWLDGPHLHNV